MDGPMDARKPRPQSWIMITAALFGLFAASGASALSLVGPVDLTVADAAPAGITLDLTVSGDAYLDLSVLNAGNTLFDSVNLTSENGTIHLYGSSPPAWPYPGASTAPVDDAASIEIAGDTLLTPDSLWAGGTLTLVATHDVLVFGGALAAEHTITLTATSDIILESQASLTAGDGGTIDLLDGSVSVDPGVTVTGGSGGSYTVNGGVTVTPVGGGGVVILPGDITLVGPVPLPGAAFLLLSALGLLPLAARRSARPATA